MTSRPSIYFFTLHKCASTLFGNYVLKKVSGLAHVNYATELFSGNVLKLPLPFSDVGFVYGPIRISADRESPVFEHVVAPTIRPDFLKDRKIVIFVRDPRDILVSEYFSFGFSHPLSADKNIHNLQVAKRQLIQSQSIGQYALRQVPLQVERFAHLRQLAAYAQHALVLRYEDMVEDFASFAADLSSVFDIDNAVLNQVYLRSRPRAVEEMGSHKRSGKVGGFRDKLAEDTIQQLNQALGKTLENFGYMQSQGV